MGNRRDFVTSLTLLLGVGAIGLPYCFAYSSRWSACDGETLSAKVIVSPDSIVMLDDSIDGREPYDYPRGKRIAQ